MKILVCVKQVPGSNNVEVDPVTGVLKRSGIPSKINPYDLYGIETALSLTERFGGTVDSLTMGPPQAKAVIQETVCMGVQKGTVLTDRKFAGADVLATAYTCEGWGRPGITATGTIARVGAIAVDPRIIPYGTRMFIVSDDGEYIYGIATAEDCGKSIKGMRIDLYFDSVAECNTFGIRDCTVYFLG